MLRAYFRIVLKQHQYVLRAKSPPEHARYLSHAMRFTLVVDSDEEEEARSEAELPSCFFVIIDRIKNLGNQKLVGKKVSMLGRKLLKHFLHISFVQCRVAA